MHQGDFADEIVPVTVSSRKGDHVFDEDEEPHRCNLGKIPTLILDNGTALYDSRVIVEFLDNISPTSRLSFAIAVSSGIGSSSDRVAAAAAFT